MSSIGRTEWRGSAVLGTALFLAVLFLSAIPVVKGSQQRISDTYFRLGTGTSSSRALIVLIDDESVQRYGRWPWNRESLATLVQNLDKAKAGVIGLDILLSEAQLGGSDAALEDAIRRNGRTILVDKIAVSGGSPRWNEPLERFSRVALGIGHAQALLDPDGVCRRFPAYELTLDGRRWAFAIEVARRTDPALTATFLAGHGLHLTSDNDALMIAEPIAIPISFRLEGFDTMSASTIMGSRERFPDLHGRPVLVGFGPTELGDRIITPVSGQIPSPGILVHAQILDNILSGRILRTLPIWISSLLLFVVSTVAIILCGMLKGWRLLGIAVAGSIFAYAAGFVVFAHGWSTPVGQSMLAFLVAPLLAYSSESALVERHVVQQLHALRVWLSKAELNEFAHTPTHLQARIEMVARLQDRLGSLYELHQALLAATDDAIGVFDDAGNLLLANEGFSSLLDNDRTGRLTLSDVRERIRCEDNSVEDETRIGEDMYSYRFVTLPATSLSPGGGSIVRFASLKMREQRDRARAEALGFVTHELRTPLVAIQGFSELMMRYPDSPAYARAPETIFNESKRLLALINSYLEVLQVDSGKALTTEPVRLRPLLDQAVAILAPLAMASQMTISVSVPDHEPAVIGDETLISGAILNLLSNAVKYGRPQTEISAMISATDDGVIVSVKNFGESIPSAEKARIFEPYFRASNVSASQTGWGLGLAFVKRIMEKHGGSIVVSSDEASGTVFQLRFPNQAAAAANSGGTT